MNGLTKYEQLLHRHLSLRRALQDRNIVVEKDDNDQWAIDLADVKGVDKPQAVTVYAFDFMGRMIGSFTTSDFKANHTLPRDTYSVKLHAADVTKREVCEAFAVTMNYGDGRPPQRYGIYYDGNTLEECKAKFDATCRRSMNPPDVCDGFAHSVHVNLLDGHANVMLDGQGYSVKCTGILAHLLRALVAAIVGPSPAKVD